MCTCVQFALFYSDWQIMLLTSLYPTQIEQYRSNDLTQMTFGYSRDDVGTFVPSYLSKGILADDPFVTIDTEGVGQLIKMTVENGRAVKKDLKIGVCGEHGGDPRSVRFFSNEADLTYVSCSAFRVPIARLAAAQAAVEKAEDERKLDSEK